MQVHYYSPSINNPKYRLPVSSNLTFSQVRGLELNPPFISESPVALNTNVRYELDLYKKTIRA